MPNRLISSMAIFLLTSLPVFAAASARYKFLPDTTADLDGTFGSGLREGFANMGTLAPYATFDGSVTHEMRLVPARQNRVALHTHPAYPARTRIS